MIIISRDDTGVGDMDSFIAVVGAKFVVRSSGAK